MTKLPRADIVLYDHEGRLTALAEIKNKAGTSPRWAADLRRNMLTHGGSQSAPYFLIITPDRVYLWKNADGPTDSFDPSSEVEATALFKPYFDRARVTPETVSGPAFELIVGSWLADLVRANRALGESVADHHPLTDSGFVEAVREGRVEYEIAA